MALIARFRRHYPGDVWHAPYYPTRDRVIPFGLFWLYYREISGNLALERVAAAGGVRALSIFGAQLFAKKDARLPDALRDDLRAAHLPIE